MKKLFLILLITPVIGFGQGYKSYDFVASELCSYLQGYSFSENKEAHEALDSILEVVGMTNNFILMPCPGIDNALAIKYDNIRYILYDNDWIKSSTNNKEWNGTLILAHEIGHHVNGHPLDIKLAIFDAVDFSDFKLLKKRKQELEADEFAGFVLSKLGAPIEVGASFYPEIGSDSDDTYKSHPKTQKRINAFEKGYKKAQKKGFETNNIKTAEEYFYDGLVHYLLNEFDLAIDYFSTSIIADRKFYNSLKFRAMSFQKLNDINSSNFDFLLYLKKNKKDPEVLFQLGVNYYNMSDFKKSINYLDLSISIDSTQRDAYLYRGLSNLELKNLNIGCEDFEVYVTNGGELPDLIKNICDFE